MASHSNKLSNLQLRIITGLIGALMLIGGVYYNAYTFGLLFLAVTLLSTWEFYALCRMDSHTPLRWLGTVLGGAVYVLTFMVVQEHMTPSVFLLLFPLFTLVYFFKLYSKEKKPFTNIAYTFLGILYVALPFSLFQYIAFTQGEYHWQLVAGFLFLLWASDTGAYFAGTYFGKRKLFERVSPKKSWEGSLGGLVTSVATSLVLGQYFTMLATWQWLVCSILIVVAGTYGDLVESLFKRSISIKDSGSLLPGHGGFLDRFDGLLLSSPYIAAFLSLT